MTDDEQNEWRAHQIERATKILAGDPDAGLVAMASHTMDRLKRAESRLRALDLGIRGARLRAHRIDAELGHALRSLDDAVGRLRRAKPCPTMGFAPADPIDNAKSMIREIDELLAEDAGSADARSEVRDVITVALNLAQAHGLDLASGLLEQAELNARVDALEAGQTWTEAKAAERKAVAAGCSTCEHHWFRFNGGVGATTCGLLGHRIVAYGTRIPVGRPSECPLPD